MVCPRCVSSVRGILTSMGLEPSEVGLGYAVIPAESLTPAQQHHLSELLGKEGFELLTDSGSILTEKIKNLLIAYARTEGGIDLKLSAALQRDLNIPYKQLSRTFSIAENRTIENFFIAQKIEFVKELLSYNKLSLKEIAFLTGYSSVAYLSSQFSKFTGMTLSDFRRSLAHNRMPLTDI